MIAKGMRCSADRRCCVWIHCECYLNSEDLLDVEAQVGQFAQNLRRKTHLDPVVAQALTQSTCHEHKPGVSELLHTLLLERVEQRRVEVDADGLGNLTRDGRETRTDGVKPARGFTF